VENNENMREQAARSLLGRAELEVARHWAAEVEALSEVHAILLHERQCFGALDALGDRLVAEVAGQPNDRPHQVLVIPIRREVAHEIHRDRQERDREPLQVREAANPVPKSSSASWQPVARDFRSRSSKHCSGGHDLAPGPATKQAWSAGRTAALTLRAIRDSRWRQGARAKNNGTSPIRALTSAGYDRFARGARAGLE
jgi:hypothetical protein